MAADRFSPVASAYTRVLLLPVGRIERSRFVECLRRLSEDAAVVSLADVAPYANTEDRLFAPRAFPHGSLLFNYTSSVPSESQLQLSPFELFREPLLVIGIKDGWNEEEDLDTVKTVTEQLRERYPRVVHRQLLVLRDGSVEDTANKDSVLHVDTTEEQYGDSLRLATLRLSARFLSELGPFTRSMLTSPGIQTPGQTARSLQRNSTTNDNGSNPYSRHGTPQQGSNPSSPIKPFHEDRTKSPPLDQGSPQTSFDQTTNSNDAGHLPARPDSRASNHGKASPRPPSQERVSMQGFGSATSQEKLKSRGRARAGVINASIHMLSGQWGEALRLFIEHTSKARLLSDHIWHAKGLEGVVVCLLLNAWAGIDFQVPSICYPVADRNVSANMNRFSVNIPSDFRLSLEGHPSPVTKLSTALPELFTHILKLYSSGEGSLELPLVVLSEVTIRFSRLLAILHTTDGALEQHAFSEIIKESPEARLEREFTTQSALPGSIFKSTVIELLSSIYPLSEDAVSVADQAGILAGIASVYAILDMHRKEVVVIKDMMSRLTSALIQARKKGAAEIGIHPSASLSLDSGVGSLPSVAEKSDRFSEMMTEVARSYGIKLEETAPTDITPNSARYFGNELLKLDFMKALAAFCEAVPDPKGTLLINAAILRTFGPNVAVDAEPALKSVLPKDEQVRCVAAMNRTITLCKSLGLPSLEAEYWDDFLIRDIEFLPQESGQAVIDLTMAKSGSTTESAAGGNPLLYDPNASRPNAAGSGQKPVILVQNETAKCRITLQNPYDVPVEVESLQLVTDGLDFKSNHQRFTLKPLGIQRISFAASPSSAGKCKVTGCLVKMQGCRERVFPIVSKPWSSVAPSLIKGSHENGNGQLDLSTRDRMPEQTSISVAVIDSQPTLVTEDHPFKEASLMLLDGEVCELSLTMKNISDIPAVILDITTTNDAVKLDEIVLEDDSSDTSQSTTTVLEPGESAAFTFDVTGKRNITTVHVMFTYSLHSPTTKTQQYARVITVPVSMTVNAALQVQRLDALPLDLAENGECSFVLAFDVGNAWPKSLFYSCFCTDLKLKSAEPRRCHNHEGVLAPGQVQRVFMPVARPETLHPADSEPDQVRKMLLERLRILWELEDEERKGWVDLSSLSMSDQTREVVVGSAISLSLEILDPSEMKSSLTTARTGSFVTLRATMHNRATRSLPLIVQLIPHALNSSDPALMERRIGIAGAQMRFVPPIAQGARDKVDFVICPLMVGIVELEIVVKAAAMEGDAGADGGAGAGAGVNGARGGGMWTSHKKLSLRVVD